MADISRIFRSVFGIPDWYKMSETEQSYISTLKKQVVLKKPDYIVCWTAQHFVWKISVSFVAVSLKVLKITKYSVRI